MPTNAINDTGVKYLYDKLHGEIEPVAEAVSDSEVTIKGNPLSFNTLSSQNAKSTILSLEPIQDLHGYDKPWVGGAGKNLLKMTVQGIKAAYNPISGTWSGNTFISDNLKFILITDSDNNITAIKYEITGTLSEQKYIYLDTFSGLSGNYLLSGGVSQNIYVTLMINNSWSGKYSRNPSSDTELTINSSSDTIVAAVSVGANISGSGYFYPMIRLSTETDATFQPYTNECGISGRTEIGILGCGKNLCREVEQGTLSNEGLNQSSNNRIRDKYYERVDEGKTYTIKATASKTLKFIISYYTNDDYITPRISVGTWGNTSLTFTVPSGIKYVRCVIAYADDTNITPSDISEYQLELGSRATDYSPYTESTDLTISLGQTVYGGTLDVENGKLVVDIPNSAFYQFDGTENFVEIGTVGVDKRFVVMLSELDLPVADYDLIPSQKCSHAVAYANNDGTWGKFRIVSAVVFNDKDGYMADATAFKAFLANQYSNGTPVTIVYPVATPATIQLTPNEISLLEGVNNISTDGDKITLTYRDGSVATLEDLTSAMAETDEKIAESQILVDTVTSKKYRLVVTSGVLDIEEITE